MGMSEGGIINKVKVFYSFCGNEDSNRVRGILDSLTMHSTQKPAGIIAKKEFENLKTEGGEAIHKWIKNELDGTSVTVVFLGTDTLENNFVRYQICESLRHGNAIIGVYINGIEDAQTNKVSGKCDLHTVIAHYKYGTPIYFDYINDGIYDYIADDGEKNLDVWVENAAKKREDSEFDVKLKSIKMTPDNAAS